ncbi:MAG: sigma-54-dependent transcriptional regulator [Shewanella sp.]
MCSVLIVSNNQSMPFSEYLQAANYRVTFAPCDSVIPFFETDIIILDLQGVECINGLQASVAEMAATTMLLVIADPEQLKTVHIIELILTYAWDYHTAPVDIGRLLVALGRMRGIYYLRKPWARSQNVFSNPIIHFDHGHQPNGRSAAMQHLQQNILRVAPTDIPVLITGPSGAGKELVARKIHQHSHRALGPLVVINCGAMPQGLAHSELFGHEKGSFTGAMQKRQGKLAMADGGTLFLDEIGDLPLEQQTYLLRFLQEGQFDVVGGGVCQADVRVICATHVDLQAAISAGRFRLDLFYRLNGVNLEVPSLQQRLDDLPELTHALLLEASVAMGVVLKPLSNDALTAMANHDWPGNVRELIHRLQRALIMAEGNEIEAKDLELSSLPHTTHSNSGLSLQHQKDKAERTAIEQALQNVGGKIPLAAKLLNVSRATLYRLLDKYELNI